MTTRDTAQGFEYLTIEACLELLANQYLGRVGFMRDGVPHIFPVNYRLHEGAIVFRTNTGRFLDAVHRKRTAFEVDDIDIEQHSGWSVLVHGLAEEVADPVELDGLRQLPLHPWAPGERDHYVRIMPGAITGRRLV